MRETDRKSTMFHMNTEEGRNNYNALRRRTDVKIVDEKDHWENGQLRRFVEYDETQHIDPNKIELDKTNGIPSKAGNSGPDFGGDENDGDDEEDDEPGLFPDDEESDDDTFQGLPGKLNDDDG